MPATLTFDDEFNSLSLWNGASGTWSTTPAYEDDRGNGSSLPSNGEQEWYINANYGPTSSVHPWTVDNGILTLTAQKADPSIAGDLGYAKYGSLGAYQYTSGLIETNHSFTQTYGYFEMKAQLPAGQGLWPAFWLMPANGAWPPELDVVEALGRDTSTIYTTVHTEETGAHTQQALATNVGDWSAGYHTYAVDWEADKVTFFYDNKPIYQVDTPADMHGPMYMIANLAMGGGWAGSVDASTPPVAQMNIDYIRAWSSNPYADGAPPAPPAATGGVSTPADGNQTLVAPDSGGSLQGGAGDDTLTGGASGSNYLRGAAGDDQIQGGSGFDDINGNEGNDTIHAGAGDDWAVGGKGDDLVFGEAGNDIVYGNLGNDTLFGGSGDDIVRGGQGDDVLNGQDGNDWLSGDRGHDTLTGGAGTDTFHTFSGAGVSVVTDFNPAEGDRVQVDPGDTYTVSQQGADVVIDMTGGGEMVLQHTELSALHDGWIFGA
ncbi:family 16 glycosylhydrolase [Phenylobacterium sp.]|uniref:family 16 glycosylhydrolase n=1 Tax=Phenylobacterium sp. TaxID=1871053 RepID=UPI002DF52EBB|nr:family 16 glycosylhydrolase [Phenylobacterium sp.]